MTGMLKSNITEDCCLLMFSEVVERAIRFHQHVLKIKKQFFKDENKGIDKIDFLESYESVLIKLVEISCQTIRSKKDNEWKLETLNQCLKHIRSLHKQQLNHLPKPSEPNELKRFARIINRQISKFHDASTSYGQFDRDISIYMTEGVDEETYLGDPLHEFKQTALNEMIANYPLRVKKFTNKPESDRYHITIPRIDAFNPCRWPTLMHEMGHHLGDNPRFFNNKSIEKHFYSSLELDSQKKLIDGIKSENLLNVKSWLIESWCDLLAACIMGPAFWFSQYSAFIFSGQFSLQRSHPFPLFRLMLIHKILEKRLPNSLTAQTIQRIKRYKKLIASLDSNFDDLRLLELLKLFSGYFTRTFFVRKGSDGFKVGSDEFNELIQPLLKYTKTINEEGIYTLVNNLNEGYPIPSKKDKEDEISETYTSIQEIIQSSWIERSDILEKKILPMATGRKRPDVRELFSYSLKLFNKFDQSILKSIQVSEWFDLFYEKRDQQKIDEHLEKIKNPNKVVYKGQLVDFEIYEYIKDKRIKVIPLISPKQIGTTSIDIRLGTTFQYYYPSQLGITDFTNTKSVTSSENSTKQVDLDFLEPITIGPGQFLLGHSMEYIELDDTISASLDGRSSFARSGLEIHMTAGFIEPGFVGVITFEFYNTGPNSIRLFPGIRIGQLRFQRVNEPTETYKKKGEAKYKGHLSHHHGLQTKDSEIEIIKRTLWERDELNVLKQSARFMQKVKNAGDINKMKDLFNNLDGLL